MALFRINLYPEHTLTHTQTVILFLKPVAVGFWICRCVCCFRHGCWWNTERQMGDVLRGTSGSKSSDIFVCAFTFQRRHRIHRNCYNWCVCMCMQQFSIWKQWRLSFRRHWNVKYLATYFSRLCNVWNIYPAHTHQPEAHLQFNLRASVKSPFYASVFYNHDLEDAPTECIVYFALWEGNCRVFNMLCTSIFHIFSDYRGGVSSLFIVQTYSLDLRAYIAFYCVSILFFFCSVSFRMSALEIHYVFSPQLLLAYTRPASPLLFAKYCRVTCCHQWMLDTWYCYQTSHDLRRFYTYIVV